MPSPPLRGRPAGVAEPRPPAYRRSTSLGVAAASPIRARPASMVTLSTGRSVLAPSVPRRDYDPSLSRALAALEVPGAHVPRVLQGRRLYNSSSSCALGSAGSSVNSSSPSSPAGLPVDFGTLRSRLRPLDSGRLARSRSGIFGELKKPEVPLTRTRTTVFGSRAGSVLREERDAEANGGKTSQRRPWSAVMAEDADVMMHVVTSDFRNSVSPGRNSNDGSRGRSIIGSVSPRRSVSRASVADAETDLTESKASVSTPGKSNKAEPMQSRPTLSDCLEIADAKRNSRTSSDGSGGKKSSQRIYPRAAEKIEHSATGGESSGSQHQNRNRPSQRATSEVDIVCGLKQGAVPKPETPRLTAADKQTATKEEQTPEQNETPTKAAGVIPHCRESVEKTAATPMKDPIAVDSTVPEKSTSTGKPVGNDDILVSGQRCAVLTGDTKDNLKTSTECDLSVPAPATLKQAEQKVTVKAEKQNVKKSITVSAQEVENVDGDNATSQIGEKNARDMQLVLTGEAKKVKKKKLTKKLLDVDKEESPATSGDLKPNNPKVNITGDKSNAKEGLTAKKIEVKDDINNNIYLKKSLTDNKICSATEQSKPAESSSINISSQKLSEVDSAQVTFQTCHPTAANNHVTTTAAKEESAAISSSTRWLVTEVEELKPSPCNTTVSRAAELLDKRLIQTDGKEHASIEVTPSNEDSTAGYSVSKLISTDKSQADGNTNTAVTPKPSATPCLSSEQPAKKVRESASTAPGSDHSTAKTIKKHTVDIKKQSEKFTATFKPTGATLAAAASACHAQSIVTTSSNTATLPKDDHSIPKVSVMGTADKVSVHSEVASRNGDALPPERSHSQEKVTVTHAVGAPRAGRESHRSDAPSANSATGVEGDAVTVGPRGSASPSGTTDQDRNTAVKHRDLAGRKSGLADKEKARNRNAAVVGDRLIVGETKDGLHCILGKHEVEPVQLGVKPVTNCDQSDTPGSDCAKLKNLQVKHTKTVTHGDVRAGDTIELAEKQDGIYKKASKLAGQKPPQSKQDDRLSTETAVVKKKVKIVKKRPPPCSETKQVKLTTVESANKLHFASKNLTTTSPFLLADQEKKSSKGSKTGTTGSRKASASDNTNQNVSFGDSAEKKPEKLRKKKASKAANVSKRSEKRGDLEVQDNKTKHSVENGGGSKRVASRGLRPSAENSKSATKKATKSKKSNSIRLVTRKLKSKSEYSSSSGSCSSGDYDSEEELSPIERAKRQIREEKEREEARKIEKFRRRGQRAKLKMERLKMEDDPEEYIKTPGNLRFAFMIKQDDWMRKQKEEARKKEAEESQTDGAAMIGLVTSLGDGLTSSGASRRPSADIDESPFDRRLGPLGGPPPKFRQYALEDFRLLRVLGKGAFGKVMLARMKDTRNYFAIKCLRKDKILNDEDVEDTLIERKILTLGTNHPYLCHLFCTFQSPSHLFFVLEFLNGGDLSFHLGQMDRFSTELTRFYASELVCGLRFLHKRGIIYRDLKLDNVLLDHEGHIRIADFGMCQMQIFLDRTADAFCGTVDYMAPEVVSGKNYNQSVDWWSFGIMLYEMLVGLTPFIGLDEDELFWAIRTEQPFYPRFLDPDATEIIKWLLVKDPALRLGSPECPAGGVCSQPFFRRVDWYLVERKQHDPPPFRPTLLTMADCRYFEDDYTALPARLTDIPDGVLGDVRQDRFANFDYTNPNMTD